MLWAVSRPSGKRAMGKRGSFAFVAICWRKAVVLFRHSPTKESFEEASRGSRAKKFVIVLHANFIRSFHMQLSVYFVRCALTDCRFTLVAVSQRANT